MNVMRRTILAIADNGTVSGFFRSSSLTRRLVSRFVAGESVETALAAAQELDARGITTTLDLLGENVATVEAAQAAVASYTAILRSMRDTNLEPNISVKLTMLGLDLGADVARDNASLILDVAREVGADFIIKGLRAVSDFENEMAQAQTNLTISGVHTLFLPSASANSYVASKYIREIAKFGGDVSAMVSGAVVRSLKEKFGQ